MTKKSEFLNDIDERVVEFVADQVKKEIRQYPIYATKDGERVDVEVIFHDGEIEVKIL